MTQSYQQQKCNRSENEQKVRCWESKGKGKGSRVCKFLYRGDTIFPQAAWK